MIFINRRPRLRTLFIAISLIILILPLASIFLLRWYENSLVKQTESNLIMQASWIIASYKQGFKQHYPHLDIAHYGNALAPKLRIKKLRIKEQKKHSKWQPQPATLDLNKDQILSKPPDAEVSLYRPDSKAYNIASQLQEVLKEAQLTTLAGVRIIDYQGIVVASTGEDLLLSLTNRREVAQALQGYPVRVLRQRISDEARPLLGSISRGTHLRVFLAHPVILQQRVIAVVILSRTPPDIWQVLYGKRQVFTYYGLLLLFLVIFIAWLTSVGVTRPIQALIKQAKVASGGEQDGSMPRLSHPFIYEIDQLSQTLNQMVEKQNQRAAYIKNFASHVSHEFKTPITAIKGALEILNDHHQGMSAQEIEQFLMNIDKDVSAMQQLMKRLTQLAKADVAIVSNTTQDLLIVLMSLQENYKTRLAMTITKDADEYPIFMDKELMTIIFVNLIENALQHGSAKLELQLSRHEHYYHIVIADNGCGIAERYRDKIFTPFFTTTRKEGGTGLGLAIIKNLMQAHQGDITLQNSQIGTCFRLIFKTST